MYQSAHLVLNGVQISSRDLSKACRTIGPLYYCIIQGKMGLLPTPQRVLLSTTRAGFLTFSPRSTSTIISCFNKHQFSKTRWNSEERLNHQIVPFARFCHAATSPLYHTPHHDSTTSRKFGYGTGYRRSRYRYVLHSRK
jgi:hypothetical protein